MAPFLSTKVLLFSAFVLAVSGVAIEKDVASNVPHCNDVIAAGVETADKGVECFLNMVAGTEERDAAVEELGAALEERDDANSTIPLSIDTSASAVTCANRVPSANDAGGLCSNTVPRVVSLPPAYSATRARCEVYYYRTAAFAVCNADRCSGARFTGQRSVCNRIYNTCRRRSKGGYVTYRTPNGLSSLYRQGTPDNPPIYSNC